MMYKYVYVYKWRSNVKILFDLFTPATAEVTKWNKISNLTSGTSFGSGRCICLPSHHQKTQQLTVIRVVC
jgi:hypothetical protein